MTMLFFCTISENQLHQVPRIPGTYRLGKADLSRRVTRHRLYFVAEDRARALGYLEHAGIETLDLSEGVRCKGENEE